MHRTNIGILLTAAVALGASGVASSATERGKISKIDASAKTFTLEEGSATRAFSLGTNAKVMNGPKAIRFDDLKVGEWVKVEYAPSGGKLMASRVDVAHKGATPQTKRTY